jgi:hypothetical protein
MNSRLTGALIVVLGIAIGFTASYFLENIDTDIEARRASADGLRDQASRLTATIADVRSGQVAYVARGQAEAFWISRVASLMPALQAQSSEFAASLTAPAAQSAFESAGAALDNLRSLDARVKEFVENGSALLAADVIFSDGLESASTAAAQVTAALNEELRSRNAGVLALRAQQRAVLAAAAGALMLLMIGLAVTRTRAVRSAEPEVAVMPLPDPVRFETPLPRAKPAVTPKLVSTAQLCGELAQLAESRLLPGLLERAARVLDASGIIVWIADPLRQDLRPGASYGYSDPTMARMGTIPRDASNAVAAAFRASQPRTVAADGFTNGAVLIPLLTSDGCVGVLSAEMKGGSEKDESSQALASIFAAQLATLVAAPGHSDAGVASETRQTEAPLRAAAQG